MLGAFRRQLDKHLPISSLHFSLNCYETREIERNLILILIYEKNVTPLITIPQCHVLHKMQMQSMKTFINFNFLRFLCIF